MTHRLPNTTGPVHTLVAPHDVHLRLDWPQPALDFVLQELTARVIDPAGHPVPNLTVEVPLLAGNEKAAPP